MFLPSRWTFAYVQGLVFIFLVALIWAASSILVQSLYEDFSFDSPFLLTYIGTSLFTLWLPAKFTSLWLAQFHFGPWIRGWLLRAVEPIPILGPVLSTIIITTTTTTTTTSSSSQYRVIPPVETTSLEANEDNNNNNEQLNGIVGPGDPDYPNSSSVILPPPLSSNCWSHEQHIRTAMCIAPVWFLANWSYNASLKQTSITSSTVLASTGSLFTFLFAVLAHDERFGWIKFMGVVLGVTGSILTALSDASSTTTTTGEVDDDDAVVEDLNHGFHHFMYRLLVSRRTSDSSADADNEYQGGGGEGDHAALLGDFLGLLSAVGYGGYAVQTRLLCPHDESLFSMQLLLGYIGLVNMIVLSPITLYLIVFENYRTSWFVLGALMLKGLFDDVLSDYLWLRAVMLTNATVATVGLGMTIPLAFLSDVWLGKMGEFSFRSTVGALSVLSGFVLVNLGNNDAEGNLAHPNSSPRVNIRDQSSTEELDDSTENDENRMQLRRLH